MQTGKITVTYTNIDKYFCQILIIYAIKSV